VSNSNSTANRQQRDLVRTLPALWIWCLPAGLIIFAITAWHSHFISLAVTGPLLTLGTAWIAAGCYVNARRCRRTHCVIDAILFPLLSLAGLLNIFHVTSFTWNAYVNALLIIVVISFVPECCGLRYIGGRGRSQTSA
jgi:hypothetical protein